MGNLPAMPPLFGFISGWEFVLFLMVALFLFVQQPRSGPRREEDEEEHIGLLPPPLVLFFAQGFGSGLAPKAPGTFGSLVGVLVFIVLLGVGNYWLFLGLVLASIPFSAWLCGAAEKVLQQHDPGSVVLDEIIAIPLSFLGWVTWVTWHQGGLPSPDYFTSRPWAVLAVFGLFRLFDVWKPTPVYEAQSLPGGWGVTMDDVVAAVYVNLLVLPFVWWG